MEIFALSGPSGTGKSTSAIIVAHNNYIPAIIDDGLLIYNGQKVAGISAKYEKNYIKAVKRATFFYKDHAKEVKDMIQSLQLKKILIIGTSEKMVNLIASQLKLGEIDHYIDIEAIRSSSEIKMALFIRKTEGKHVIPIPYVQVEHTFFKRIASRGFKFFSPQKEVIGETTVVQPNFQRGSITISEQVLKKIVSMGCDSFPEIKSYHHIKIDMTKLPTVHVDLGIQTFPDNNILIIVQKVQKRISEDFHKYLGIELNATNISITKITLES